MAGAEPRREWPRDDRRTSRPAWLRLHLHADGAHPSAARARRDRGRLWRSLCTAVLILLSGKNPVIAFQALFCGAFGSFDRVAFALNKATPYLLSGIGVALCFRASIINIGGEGQIAIGGLAPPGRRWRCRVADAWRRSRLRLLAGTVGRRGVGGLAAVIQLSRRVHEVLVTLLLNFVALLLVGEALHGRWARSAPAFRSRRCSTATAWLPSW